MTTLALRMNMNFKWMIYIQKADIDGKFSNNDLQDIINYL